MQELLRSTRIVLVGMATSQAIPILGSLLITRLYLPDAFGIFAAWVGMTYVAAILLTGRLEMALAIVPDGAKRRYGVFATTLTALASSTLLFMVVAVLVTGWPNLFPSIPTSLIWLFIPASLSIAISQIWQNWAAANGAYKILSKMRVWLALCVTALQIMVGYFLPTALALALTYVVGTCVGCLISIKLLPLHFEGNPSIRQLISQVISFFRSQKSFPKFALPAGVINSASSQLPVIFIASKFGLEASGLYALATRVLGAPIGLMGKAVLDVFKRTASKEFREQGHCRKTYRETLLILGLCALVLAIGVIWLAEPAFGWLFGRAWKDAGTIAVWLMPLFALRFMASPLSYVFYIANKQGIELIWQCSLFMTTIASFTFAVSFEQSINFYVAGYGALYMVYLVLSYRYSKGLGGWNHNIH